MPGAVWAMSGIWGTLMTVLFFVGFLIVLLSTFLINHFDLFGLQQVWSRFKSSDLPAPKFVTPLLYKWVRHPLYAAGLLFIWLTPVVSQNSLIVFIAATCYIFVGALFEERKLVREFGVTYTDYKAVTPMLIPGLIFPRNK